MSSKIFASFSEDGPIMAYDDDARNCMRQTHVRLLSEDHRGSKYNALYVLSWAVTHTINNLYLNDPDHYDVEKAIACLCNKNSEVEW